MRDRDVLNEECQFAYRSSVFRTNHNRYVVLEVTFLLERSPYSQPIKNRELCKALQIERGERALLGRVRETVLRLRSDRGMVLDPGDHDTWSVGSFFKNPLLDRAQFSHLRHRARKLTSEPVPHEQEGEMFKPYAAWLIEHAGFQKGYPLDTDPRSAITVSTKHALALTNRGSGRTEQLLDLAAQIVAGVQHAFGVTLEPEPAFAGLDWDGRPDASSPIKASGDRPVS